MAGGGPSHENGVTRSTPGTDPAGRGRGETRGLVMQVLASITSSMANFCLAGSLSFGGVLADQLTTEDADLNITKTQVSWVVSIFSIGSMLGFIVSSYASPRLGAVRIMQLSSPAALAAWVVMAFSPSFWSLLAGRAMVGLFNGVCMGPAVAYMGEVSSVRIRGYLTTLPLVNGCMGVLASYLFGWLVGWRHACLVMGAAPALQFLMSLLLPRSAKWLISKGYPEEEAKRSLRFYQGEGFDADGQIREIRESLGGDHKHDASVLEVLCLLRHRQNLVPFLLVLAMYMFFVFSGGSSTSSFAPVVFRDLGGFEDPYLGSILSGTVRVISTVVALLIMDRVERRTLLMVNGIGGAAGCLATGLAFVYKAELADHAWVPVLAVLVIVCLMSTGICTVVFVMLSELLPNAIRAEVGGVCLLFFGAANFVMMYSFPLAVSRLGIPTVYWFFTGMHLLLFAFGKVCLPRTRGKSLEEIQKMFVKNIVLEVTEPVGIHVETNKAGDCTKL
ncbi:facilitated trehalose transporter Tret1-like [Pollicipes pollicipes]|uniref:facilitated trehalose transporter Tret1-like n=1 Tax=Pollicipes pollicipes TaxID=41117 RepID=UPI0018856714|nr:facilitated trehalose transporter Tret1-like [Pollicipes pollicipes]